MSAFEREAWEGAYAQAKALEIAEEHWRAETLAQVEQENEAWRMSLPWHERVRYDLTFFVGSRIIGPLLEAFARDDDGH